MARQDTTEFLAAFAVGTVLGIGATLLLRPAPPRTAKDRLLRELKPYRKKMRRGASRIVREVREQRRATGALGDEAIDAGRELLGEFRDEVRRILSDAREELGAAMEERRKSERRSTERRKHERRHRAGGLRFGRSADEQ